MSIIHLRCVRTQCRAQSSLVSLRAFSSQGALQLVVKQNVQLKQYDMCWQQDRLGAGDLPLPQAKAFVAPARPAAELRDEVYIMPAAAAPAQASSIKETFLRMHQA